MMTAGGVKRRGTSRRACEGERVGAYGIYRLLWQGSEILVRLLGSDQGRGASYVLLDMEWEGVGGVLGERAGSVEGGTGGAGGLGKSKCLHPVRSGSLMMYAVSLRSAHHLIRVFDGLSAEDARFINQL
ncbi:hypothetical protein Tco_1105861 [Tanacetum coccineum]